MTSTQLEAVLLVSRSDDVNDSRSVLLLIQTLQDQVVTLWSFVLHQVVGLVFRSDLQWVSFLTDFTFERSPIERGEVGADFELFLYIEPAS